jgi:hypothetical protein
MFWSKVLSNFIFFLIKFKLLGFLEIMAKKIKIRGYETTINCEETHVEIDAFLFISRQHYDGSATFKNKAIFKQINESLYLLLPTTITIIPIQKGKSNFLWKVRSVFTQFNRGKVKNYLWKWKKKTLYLKLIYIL